MKSSALKLWKGRILSEWRKMGKEFVPPKGTSRLAIFSDYILCVIKYHISYSEYFEQYKFYTLKACEREEYITRSQAHKIEVALNKQAKDIFWFKDKFLKKFSSLANRNWIAVKDVSIEEFIVFAYSNQKFIVKPVTGSLGKGIRIVDINEVEDKNELYNELYSGDYIAEEYITACKEIAEFNPGSLNTIRIVTFVNKSTFKVFGSFIRMGMPGSLIDNAHAGGVFATIDVESGIVTTQGVNTKGESFIFHPASGKQIIGFQIPVWEKIIDVCRKAAALTPEAKIVGWDVAVTDKYEVVMIEGNHMPDFDVMQSPARRGVKKDFLKAIQ